MTATAKLCRQGKRRHSHHSHTRDHGTDNPHQTRVESCLCQHIHQDEDKRNECDTYSKDKPPKQHATAFNDNNLTK